MIETEQENIKNLNDESLLQLIWSDKNGRSQRAPRASLFVALDHPCPNLSKLTKSMLQALSDNPDMAEDWADTWGKVVACVGPSGKFQCVLREDLDDRNRSLVKLESTTLLDPADLIKDFPSGQLATIIINNQPTTAEGFIITYTHMVDELIWSLYQEKLKLSGYLRKNFLYNQALQEVMEKGFSLKIANTSEILDLKRQNLDIPVRLYGSKVNKQVQSVMGAVVFNQGVNTLKESFINSLESEDPSVLTSPASNLDLKSKLENAKPTVITSVTFGKELHAGHLLLLATADLIRLNLGSRKPLVIINNNTGPRPAATLATLSEETGLPIEVMAAKLVKTELPCDRLISAYRSRKEAGELFDQSLRLLEAGGLDIFAVLTRRVRNRLAEGGFQTSIVSESDALRFKDRILQSVNPIWAGSGFCFLPHLKEVRIIEKNGLLTSTGKAVSSLTAIARQQILRGETPLLTFIDSAKDAQDACFVFSETEISSAAISVPGAGISFNGEIASGSKGEALTLTDILDAISETRDRNFLSQALRYMILSRPLTVENIKSPDLTKALYDFRDNRSFIKDLILCAEQSKFFEEETQSVLNRLVSKIGRKTELTDQSFTKYFEFLTQRTQSLIKANAQEIIAAGNKVKVVGVSGEFKKVSTALQRSIDEGSLLHPPRIILESILAGEDTARALLDRARDQGVNISQETFNKDFKVGCDILDTVLRQGYFGVEAISKSLKYLEGPSGLMIRDNFYLKSLRAALMSESSVVSLNEEDYEMLKISITFCMERLGYGYK